MVIAPELRRMHQLLEAFLGSSKNPLDDSLQLQFSCPRCQEREGDGEKMKFHLEINLAKGLFNCWKCSSMDDEMHGSIYRLIRMYGSEDILRSYKEEIKAFKESSLYKVKFSENDFLDDYADADDNRLKLPENYVKLTRGMHEDTPAFKYLSERGIGWPIIDDYSIGFTGYNPEDKKGSRRIILPSFDSFGELNYWTGRDYTGNKKRQRYNNPDVNRKGIIFNEEKIQWNADLTLVEGPFDSLVVPNSVPLLGKALTPEYELYKKIMDRCNAHVNIFLDCDALNTALMTYRTLNVGRLRGRIRIIMVPDGDIKFDPSKIYELYGYRGIVGWLNSARELKNNEIFKL